jgi:methylated-DNA-protein-cysteine methyltransferase related protein
MYMNHKAVYSMVSRIPEGRIATYGQVAALIGFPKHARQVGYALAALENNSRVPWHRVINAKGKISPRGLDGCDDYQRLLLEEEGVIFGDKDCISLKQFQWQPDSVELSDDK